MEQFLELEPPKTAVEQGVVPESVETIQAGSLLAPEEFKTAQKRGWLFGVEVEGKTYLVPAHRQVPKNATLPRTSSGSLVGVAAVTGG